jgi:hypothetical protein
VTAWPHSAAFPLTLLGAVVLMLAFDALGSWFTRATPLVYRHLWPVQFLLYVVIGYVTTAVTLSVNATEIVGGVAAFAEATAGWAIAWKIGPGRMPNLTRAGVVRAVIGVTILCWGCTILGALAFTVSLRTAMHAH